MNSGMPRRSITLKKQHNLDTHCSALNGGYFLALGVDNGYFQVYNRIKSQKGELTMFRYCFNVVDNKSGNGMNDRTIGLALSYSFLR